MADQWRMRHVERNVSLGLQDPRDIAVLEANGYVGRDGPSKSTPLADLLRHMAAHYSDSQLKNDLDAALACCGSDGDRSEVKRFAKAKLAGKPYLLPEQEEKTCERCSKPFAASRSDARFCSTRCRKSASRKTARACHT